MAVFAARLPRLVVLCGVFLFAAATLTYGAAKRLTATAPQQTVPAAESVAVVPDVTGQAFVFAKGELQDAGFAWQVTGSVHGYAGNKVVSQSPVGGTRLKNTGTPTVRVMLARSGDPEVGDPEDASPYRGTPVISLDALHTAAAPKKKAAPTKVSTSKPAQKEAAAKREPAFVVPNAPKEPQKEMPLPRRAALLSSWLAAHPKPTNANVRYFLYQHAWVVTGAKFGWWHGAEALKLLIAADRRAAAQWGIGRKSELAARRALAEVEARSK